jgi:SAM-dependent methyltransferase
MNLETIKKLNKLNLDFYQTIADDFDQSRQQPWEGWRVLVEKDAFKRCSSVIDIGCGNGRFANFIHNYGITHYFGSDSNPALLKQAQQYATLFDFFKLKKIDFISTLIEESTHIFPTEELAGLNFPTQKLFSVFGVMHHVPSFELRKLVISKIEAAMQENDLLAVSCWQFTKIPNLMARQVSPNTVALKPDELEKNDYILDWQRGSNAYRYCHQVTTEEMNKLLEQSNLHIVDQWDSDGKTNNLNTYYLLQKKQYNS